MSRRIVVLVHPGVQALDVVGPVEVFALANRLRERQHYSTELVSPAGGDTPCSNGVVLAGVQPLRRLRGLDTLLVAGGPHVAETATDPDVQSWVRAVSTSARRTAAVCSGAFVLAAAGLLDGKRATTHWSGCALLAERFPEVEVETDPIFVRDGSVYTSAGISAGIDLALALVEEDHGPDLALDVARWLVVFVKRPGGQDQFSAQLAAQVAGRPAIRAVQEWIPDNLQGDLSVAALARRADMSSRNFARSFREEVGCTPGDYVERARVEAARALLETTDQAVKTISRDCGFARPETFDRAFRRVLGITPREYRDRFARRERSA